MKNRVYDSINNKDSRRTQQLIKFIHASDLHLGCAQYQNEYRSDDFITAFYQVLSLGIQKKVDFLILSGDVFTSIDILPEKFMKIIKMLEKFKNKTKSEVPIIAIEGNHDLRKYSRGLKTKRNQSWLQVLNHLGLIILLKTNQNDSKSKRLVFRKYNHIKKNGNMVKIKFANIFGTSYEGETPKKHILDLYNSINKKKDEFNILIQHFGIAGQMDNVPGLKFGFIKKLRNKVDYLALGHYHLQYQIDNWIYNPGSTEAVCSIDTIFKRGVFLVEVKKNETIFEMSMNSIHLRNRKFIWETIYLPVQFKTKTRFLNYVLKKLSIQLKDLKYNLEHKNYKMPVLYLKVIGIKSEKSYKIKKKELKNLIHEKFPVLDL